MEFRTKETTINDLLKYKYILGKNVSDRFNCLYTGTDNENDINTLLKTNQSLYEYIRKGSRVKPYIDYDGYDRDAPDKNQYLITKENISFLTNTVKVNILKRLVNIFIHSLNVLGCNIDETNVLILDGSRIIHENKKRFYKISFHITTNDCRFVFKNTNICKRVLLPTLEKSEQELYNNVVFCKGKKPPIDRAVYGSTQKFRTVFSSKTNNDLNIFQPINIECEEIKENDPIKYLVQYFKEDYIIIQTPLHLCSKEEKEQTNVCSKEEKEQTNVTIHTTENKPDFINDYSFEIQKRLKLRGMTTATVNYSINNGYVNYNILYNGIYDKCIYGNDHDRALNNRSVCYSYIKNGSIYGKCWGTMCKDKEPINMGCVLEMSPMDNNHNIVNVNVKYLTENKDNEVNKECNKFIQNDLYKVLCIKSGTGTGKTYLLNTYIPLYEEFIRKQYDRELRIILLSTRQSYARSICSNSLKNLNIVNYLDRRENSGMKELSEINRLCISIEGLNELMFDGFKPYDIVILDESESISRHIFSNTVRYGSYRAFEYLRELTQRSKKIFLMDADLSSPSLKLINDIDNKQVLKINNTYSDNNKKYIITKNKNKFIENIKTDLKNNMKLYIVVLSLTNAKGLYSELETLTNELNKKFLPINSESGELTKRQLDNVNEHWINYDLIITTSTTGAGVDFNPKDNNGNLIKHFDKVYGFCSSGCSAPSEFLQIIDRVRNPKSMTYNILIDSKITIPNEESHIHTYEQSKYKVSQMNNTELTDTITYSFLDNEGYVKRQHIKTERDPDYSALLYYYYLNTNLNNTNSNFLLILKLIIESRNNICEIDSIKHKQGRVKPTTLKELKEVTISDYTKENIQSMRDRKYIDIETKERRVLEKIRICNKYNIHRHNRDNEEIVNVLDFETDRKKKRKIHTILCSYIKEDHIIESNLIRNEKQNTELSDKIFQNILNVKRRLTDLLNYDYTNEFKITIERMNEIESKLNLNTNERNSISPTKLTNFKYIQKLLVKYGLTLKKDYDIKKVNKKTVRTHTGYIIKPEEEVYSAVSLLIDNVKYEQCLNSLCSNYTKYKFLQIKDPSIKQKRIV